MHTTIDARQGRELQRCGLHLSDLHRCSVGHVDLAMQTPDGAWRVEVYRQPPSRAYWYRLVHGDNRVEGLTITGVERLLAEAGYDMGDLEDAAA